MRVERSFRLLACEFEVVVVDCERLARNLVWIARAARQDHPTTERHRFVASREEEDRYSIEWNGELLCAEPGAGPAAASLSSAIHQAALAALPDFTRVHAACIDWSGQRFLLVGARGAGKTTLATRLLFEGFDVRADELALVRGGEALPFPRRFRVKPGTAGLVPQLKDLLSRRPAKEDDWGEIDFIDPSDVGLEWRIASAPVDAIFFLEARHGGSSRLEPCPKIVMAQLLMSQSRGPQDRGREWIREVCLTLQRVACYRLFLGNLDNAVTQVRSALALEREAHDE